MNCGTGIGAGPFQYCMMFSRMNDMPIAVISGARRGALRSRRYASRSMTTPVSPHSSIETRMVSSATPISGSPCSSPETPSSERVASEKNVPSVYTSPWAKLMSSMIP